MLIHAWTRSMLLRDPPGGPHGTPLGSPWDPPGLPMGSPRAPHGTPPGSPWDPPGLPTSFLPFFIRVVVIWALITTKNEITTA